MTLYILGYIVAFALGIISLYLERKYEGVKSATVKDALILAGFSLLSWIWAFCCTLMIVNIYLKEFNLTNWLDKELFK